MATLPQTLAATGRNAAPALVLATAIVASALSYLSARSVSDAQVGRRFDEAGVQTTGAIEKRLDAYALTLRSFAGLVNALGRAPTAAEFHAQFTAVDPGVHFPGVQGLGWVAVLGPGDVAAFERAVRATGRREFQVWPPGQRDPTTTILHLEPLDWRNQRAIGFDMFSEPVRREAMARARDTGLPAASGKVELVQEVGASRQSGFLIYLPLYRDGAAPETIEERRAALLGWVYAPFRARDLLRSTVLVEEVPGLRLDVYDGLTPSEGALLATLGDLGDAAPERVRVTTVQVDGRPWTLRLSASPAFRQPAERQLPQVVAAVAAAIALLLFWINWREAQARARAERMAVRNAFLADAGRLLAASFDYFRTLDDVVRLAAGQIAEGAIVYLDEPAEPLWLVGLRDPDAARAVAGALRGWRPRSDDAIGPAAALRAGAPQIHRRIDWSAPPLVRVPEALKPLRAARVRAALTVPLIARGEPLGAVVLLSARRLRAFPPDGVALGEDLARLIVAAVESARLYRRAQEAIRSRDEFLSIASHELKTPITSLSLQADSLRSSAARGDAETLLRKVEVVRRNVRRLSSLVSTMLDLSRIQAGRLELEPEQVDLAEIAREVVARFDEEAQRAHSPLHLDAPAPAIGRWDRLRLDQVVTNLVSNALKYGRGQPVDVRVHAAGERVLLEVRDRGIGISPDDQPRIFERFERAVSERHYGGFGLGLWIVREVVAAMGGEIRVVSAPGEGSTFTVELHRTPPALAPPASPLRPLPREKAEPGG